MNDLIIIGGGPGGVAGGVYASRKRMKTILFAESFGGQSSVSPNIQNWIGTPSITGTEFGKSLKQHLLTYSKDCLEIKEGELVLSIEKIKDGFKVLTNNNECTTKTILIASGSKRRKLDVLGSDKLEHKGLTYCASCDGPIFSGKDMIVIGGGNSAFESASQLSAYAKSVTIIHRNEKFKAEPITIKKVLESKNIKTILNTELVEIKGDKFVSSVLYKNKITGEIKELKTSAVFVEIGSTPNTSFVEKIIKLNDKKEIPVDHKTQKTEVLGIWSAGDCTDGLYHQNNIASGDAVKAIEDIYLYLNTK